jgi:hypothetical protein
MAPTPPPSREPPTISVSELEQLPGGLWSVLLTFPDLTTRRVVIPDEIASVSGIQLTTGVIAELYQQGKL